MAIAFVPSPEQLNRIQELAGAGETLSSIAIYIGKDRCCVKRILKNYNIELKPSIKNKSGKRYDWNAYKLRKLKDMYLSEDYGIEDICKYFETSESTIVKKAKELGLSKVPKKFFSNYEIEYLKENAGKKTLKEMSVELKKNDWVIGKKLTELGITVRLGKKVLPPDTEEFENDLKDPRLSNVDLAEKYGIHYSTIRKWRKEKYPDSKLMINTWLHKSSNEIKFEELLDGLDVIAEFQKKIKGWKVDYYLGFHVVVEIQGGYWHDKKADVIERDRRKHDDLTANGFNVIYITEDELKNDEFVKQHVLDAMYRAVLSRNALDN
jgi:very-short-patch-repair endonuclease